MDNRPDQDPMVMSSRSTQPDRRILVGSHGLRRPREPCRPGVDTYKLIDGSLQELRCYPTCILLKSPSTSPLFTKNFGNLPMSLPFRRKLRETGPSHHVNQNVYGAAPGSHPTTLTKACIGDSSVHRERQNRAFGSPTSSQTPRRTPSYHVTKNMYKWSFCRATSVEDGFSGLELIPVR
ncbi:hypothetical protein M5K25_006595 [Dendrobium thyrsiflorum]|uniref:Uncharacterized protein n=1 Tax=Dendrobium thyrsiflorum TaxID=117978 RepID=A0ABD0VC03_DENTH